MTHALPWRGLGLSSNLNAGDQPHPYRLLDARPGLFDFVEYSAPLSLAEARAQATLFSEMDARRAEVPVLFHPVHLNLYGPELESARALAELAEHARAVESAWVGNDIGWWHQGGEPFPGYFYLPPPLTEAGVADSAVHALHVQAALPVPLVLENPAVIALRGGMHVLDFMAQVHARTGLPLLIDLGHLLSYQLSRGLPLLAGLDGFPLEQVVELHLAGGVVTSRDGRRFYADDHTQPVREELFELLEAVLPRCARLRAVTFEGDGHPPEIAALTLQRLRQRVPSRDPRPVEVGAPLAAPETALTTRPWELFDEAYGGKPAAEDAEGAAAERELRLAVLAQALDAQWPATRLLVAGAREELEAFAASEDYRAAFGGGGSVGRAFGVWARRLVRERRDEAASTALAFETWAHGVRAQAKAPGPGEVGLAPGVAIQAFPFDLSELLFALKALRRHLAVRAWVGGGGEGLSALDSLRQVALRPGPGPWRVAVRREAGRLDVRPIPARLDAALRVAEGRAKLSDFLEGRAGATPEAAREAVALGLVRGG